MSVVSNVAVEQVSSKPVTTRFGNKTTYSFKAGGDWFKTNFKAHGLSAGDVISFSYTDGTYGKEVDPATIEKGATSVSSATAASAGTGGGSTAKANTYSGGGKGVFPIGALDGQRSIIRQNALTNAREVFVANMILAKKVVAEPNEIAEAIIELARKFEAYTAGDLDADAAAEEVAKAA